MVVVILADKVRAVVRECNAHLIMIKYHIYFEVFLLSADQYIVCLDMTLKCCLCPS